MIAEIIFKNLLSFRGKTVFRLEADNSKDIESYHVVELTLGVYLLKLVVVYGANASGKSNFIKICDFFKMFIIRVPLNKNEKTGILLFLIDKVCSKQPSDFCISFYAHNEGLIIKNKKLAALKHRYEKNKNILLCDNIIYQIQVFAALQRYLLPL